MTEKTLKSMLRIDKYNDYDHDGEDHEDGDDAYHGECDHDD